MTIRLFRTHNTDTSLQVSGALHFTPTDAIAMLQLCSYETDSLGYSAFCGLFSAQDFENYEYYFDLVRRIMQSFSGHCD